MVDAVREDVRGMWMRELGVRGGAGHRRVK